MGVDGNFLKLIERFFSNRYQRVVLNGQASSRADIKAGVPEGSILSPLFFLIYINDLSENLKPTVKLSADDALIFHFVKKPLLNGRTDGKCHLIWTLCNKLRKYCFLIKLRRQVIQVLYLMVYLTVQNSANQKYLDFSFCVCIVLYISIFFQVYCICRCACYGE